MPTHPLISYMESPDGLGQDLLDDANTPGAGSSMTPHGSMGEKPAAPADGSLTADCMFCDQTFQHQDELSPHVLTQHPTTLFGPAVLRVEAQFLTPGERARAPAVEREEDRSCVVCGQAVEDAAELEGHMRKHRDSFTYSCGLCGRRFREPWFLKNHMRTHSGKAGARNKTQLELESPATINDVVVDQAAMPAVSSPYRMCMVCGFFFPNKEGLAEHSKVHSRDLEANEDEGPPVMARVSPKAPTSQQSFLQLLGLQAQPLETGTQPERSARWIAELDPFNTYQAWQLATKGKIAVGPGLAKELGPDTGSDVEDSCSDKEELGEIWSGGRSGKSIKDGFRRELRSRRPGGETPSPEPEPKSLAKEKPTQCKDCGKTFRTYHQLVLHSRVHKKERVGADSPTTSVDGKQGSTGSGEGGLLDRASEGSEDGSEEGGPAETCQSDKSEDGFDTSKLKVLAPSKECSYCGKSFRSNYYLNIHLRTHTGEKPYKCEHCDYAAAQKTSLRYHLDRRHRDVSEVGTSAKLASPSPPLGDTKEKATPELAGSTEGMGSGTGASCQRGKSDMPSSGLEVGVSRLVQGESGELTAGTLHCPASADSSRSALLVHLDPKTEGVSIKQESAELPLDLSLKASLSVAVGCVPRSSLITNACPLCAFKTLYPEVLLMHKALVHKDKSDATRKNILRGSALKQKRHTGCPPALEGKDVAPLPHTYSRYPRRTKSPQPQPAKVSEKAPLAQAAKRLPSTEPRRAALPESHPGSPGTRHGIARLPDRQPELNGVYRRDGIIVGIRQSPPEGEGAAFKARQACNGSAWSSCLSARFGNLPQVEFGEPYSKRPKLSSAPGRDPEGSEAPGARRGDGYGRLVLPGQNSSVKGLPQRSPPSRTTQSFAPPKLAPSPVGETDWNVINILRSYSPGDLASLYHPAVAGSSHGGVPSPVPGNRPLLYQHYPTSVLQRRHNLSPMSNAHCGAADKNA